MPEKFYITTAIDYPNAKPHIGHAFEKIISDAVARWNRQKGMDVLFSTGTDEHGQKLEKYSKEAKVTPKEFVDEKVLVFKELCRRLNISNDLFIRTTDEHHEKLARDLFDKVLAKGDIYLGKYSGNYCIYDETFFTEKDLVEGNKCPICKRETQVVEEDAYFFRMGRYQDQIIKYIEETDAILPKTRQNEILYRLKNQEVRDLCVSRTSFSWGIPLKNNPDHVIYVWFDALLNYLSAIDYPNGKNAKYWPASFHVIGKDIIWFHTVIWPAMLLSLDIPLPKKVYAHGFILAKGGEKMSKSKGNALDPLDLVEKYGADALRFYLTRIIPSADDGFISEKELVEKYNNELGNDLGNLVMRCVKLGLKKIQGSHDKLTAPANYVNELSADLSSAYSEADARMNDFEYDKALASIWAYVKRINLYLTEKEPWKLGEEESDQIKYIIYTALDNLCAAAALLKPFIPNTAEVIESQLGTSTDLENIVKGNQTKIFALTDRDAIFPRIEWKDKEEFALSLKVGKIMSAEPHPDAEKLLVLQISMGDEKRQLVAGLRKHYEPSQLVGKQVVVVANLKPAKLRGIDSQGMVLAGVDGEIVSILDANGAAIGSLVTPGDEFDVKSEQIKIEDFAKVELVIKDGKVYYHDRYLRTSAGPIKVDLNKGKVY